MAVSPIDLVLLVMFVPVVALLAAAPVRGRAWSGSWLLVVGALYVPLFEDGFLATWLAMAPPTVDPHGVAGLVEPHAQGHMLGAGVATIVLSVLAVWIARRPLRRAEPWAWWALLGVGVSVVGVGVIELALFYDHGLPLPTWGEHGGFGWGPWLAGFLAWGAGLWMTRPGAPEAA